MKILFSELPKYPWWQNGIPFYENNLAMKVAMELNYIPDQTIVFKEHTECLGVLKRNVNLSIKSFPAELDANALNKHDAIFVRDSFISNQQGTMVVSNFSEKERLPEASAMKQ